MTSCCEACQPSPSAWPNASETGSAVISPAALSPRSTSPAPWPVTLSSRIERALPVSRLLQVERAQARAHLGEHRRGAGDHGGGRARAVDRAVARRAVVVGARLGGRERDARRGQVGLDAAVEGEPARGERRDPALAGVVHDPRQADRDGRVLVRPDRGERGLRDAQRHADDRDVHRLVDAEPAGRELRAVHDHRGRPRAGGVLDRELRIGAAVDERGAVGDEAAAVAVEERAQARAARRAARRARARAGARRRRHPRAARAGRARGRARRARRPGPPRRRRAGRPRRRSARPARRPGSRCCRRPGRRGRRCRRARPRACRAAARPGSPAPRASR